MPRFGESAIQAPSPRGEPALKDRLLEQYGDQIEDKSTLAKMVGTNQALGGGRPGLGVLRQRLLGADALLAPLGRIPLCLMMMASHERPVVADRENTVFRRSPKRCSANIPISYPQ